jgi:peptidyl-prolyl cis-trans isomerase B (cyclophilin B)
MTAQAWMRYLAGLALAAALVAGCSETPAPTPDSQEASTPPPGVPVTASQPASGVAFDECTLADVPDQILADRTMTGKSVGKLYTEVARLWSHVPLTQNGKPVDYHVVMETEAGVIEIDLWPAVAPNHVRNFVALARAGYYEGLLFERTIAERASDPGRTLVELIEGGCPLGLGTSGHGSLGYWLAPEIAKDVKHEAGSFGACRGEHPDSAACRFYITLGPAPVLDGERTIFGKLTRGLDVARRIATQPLLNSPEFPDGTRPEKPIVIRKVTVVSDQ